MLQITTETISQVTGETKAAPANSWLCNSKTHKLCSYLLTIQLGKLFWQKYQIQLSPTVPIAYSNYAYIEQTDKWKLSYNAAGWFLTVCLVHCSD